MLAADEVHLWIATPANSADHVACYEAILTPDERRRYLGFRFDRHRQEYLVTRALLQDVLGRYLPRPTAGFRFERESHGRPRLSPPAEVDFNLANHPSLVVCGVSRSAELGVDVEPIARGADVLELADSVFSRRERDALARLAELDQRRQRAVLLWTLKEAYLKARGTGLSLPLQGFSVEVGAGGELDLVFEEAMDVGPWSLGTVVHDGHRISVAVRGAGPLRLTLTSIVPRVTRTDRPFVQVSSERPRP